MRLRLDLANAEKFLVDLEVKNIMGQLSDEAFQQKKARLEQVRDTIVKEIAKNEENAENIN